MSIKAVLFDLDGTLLPMDQEEFVKAYFGLLAKRLAPLGYEAERLYQVLWKGVAAMVQNDGSCVNEDVFWKVFADAYGEECLKDKPFIDEFYEIEFNRVQAVCGFEKAASEVVEMVKAAGKYAVLATNPLFPHTATENRMRWAGLKPEDFTFYTTYENSRYCKPNPKYYEEILQKLHLKPEECIMVGNDFGEDIVPTEKLGMQGFLLTDYLIHKGNQDISEYPQGVFTELKEYFRGVLK